MTLCLRLYYIAVPGGGTADVLVDVETVGNLLPGDRAHQFIAAPNRQHCAGKLIWIKQITPAISIEHARCNGDAAVGCIDAAEKLMDFLRHTPHIA